MKGLENGHDATTGLAKHPVPATNRKSKHRATAGGGGAEVEKKEAACESTLEAKFPGVLVHLVSAKTCLAPLAEKIVEWKNGEHIENANEVDETNDLAGDILCISQAMRRAVLAGEHVRYDLDLYSEILAACEKVYDLGWEFADSGSTAVATDLLFKAASVVALLESAVVKR